MSFLAMIIALLLLQLRSPDDQTFYDKWLGRIDSSLRGLGLSMNSSFVLSIVIPVLAVIVVLSVLEPILFGLLWIAATAAVLLYCFGRGDFQALQGRYRAYFVSGNFESAWLNAQTDLAYTPKAEGPDSSEEFLLEFQGRFLYEGYQRWFAVLFYFVILGPQGALAYRLLHLCKSPQTEELAARLLFYADWLPLRLLAATFSLTGDFLRSRDELLASFGPGADSGDSVLLATARAALGMEASQEPEPQSLSGERGASQLIELGALLSRSAIFWLLIISVIVVLL